MDKKETAMRLLNLIGLIEMLDRETKKATDGAPSFCDMDDYKESKGILGRAAIGILRQKRGEEDDRNERNGLSERP